MTIQEQLLAIVRAVAKGGPPVRYNEGEDLEDNRKDGTYDCRYCGPQSFTLNEAYSPDAHAVTCPWRMATELLDELKGNT